MVFNSNSDHYTCYTSTLHSLLGLSHIRLFLYFSSKRCPCRIKILIVFIFTLDEFQGLSNILGFPLTLLPMHFFHWSAGNVNYFCVNENWVKCPFFKTRISIQQGPALCHAQLLHSGSSPEFTGTRLLRDWNESLITCEKACVTPTLRSKRKCRLSAVTGKNLAEIWALMLCVPNYHNVPLERKCECLLWSSHNQVRKVKGGVHNPGSQITVYRRILLLTHFF